MGKDKNPRLEGDEGKEDVALLDRIALDVEMAASPSLSRALANPLLRASSPAAPPPQVASRVESPRPKSIRRVREGGND
jgi:hypothetical protein